MDQSLLVESAFAEKACLLKVGHEEYLTLCHLQSSMSGEECNIIKPTVEQRYASIAYLIPPK